METVQSADGTSIAIDRSGDGPAVIVVLGAFCDRSSSTSLAAALAPGFTVYEYDRRGRGDSTDTPPYAVEREVEDLEAVIKAAGGSAYVYGHSSGACLALEAAARGVPITRLAAYEPPYATPDGSLTAFAEELSALIADGKRSETATLFMRGSGAPAEVVEQRKASPYWPRMEALAHTLPYDARLCGNGIVPAERFAAITVPTLALAGGNSPAWAPDSAAAIAAAVPDGQYRVLDGQDHAVADDALVPVLQEFFR
jgi:pimeloyl-ACP methyl ester carboxylesterase